MTEELLRKYLEGELPEKEANKVKEWLSEHSDDESLKEWLDKWFNSLPGGSIEEARAAMESVCGRLHLGERNRRGIFTRILKVAALIAVPIALFLGYRLLSVNDVEWIEKTVPSGKTEKIALSDGSVIILNSKTRITYPSRFKGRERVVFVEGEVLADIAKNPRKPFVMKSSDVQVQVLGTKFDFKSYGNSENVEVLLMEGSVRLNVQSEKSDKEVMMSPGEMVHYNRRSGDVQLGNFNMETFRPFTENRALHFFNLPMKDIACDLERTFGVRIEIKDKSLAETRFFAIFTNNETLEDILNALNADGRMSIDNHGDKVSISLK